MDIVSLFSLVVSPALQEKLLLPRIILGLLSAAMLGFVVWAFFHTSWIRFAFLVDTQEFLAFRAYGLHRLTKRWQAIQARLQTANEAEYKLAIIEADTMLEEALQRMGFPGATLDDRLKNLTPTILPNIEDLRQAHTLRNNIVYDPNFRLSLAQATNTLSMFEKGFQALDLI